MPLMAFGWCMLRLLCVRKVRAERQMGIEESEEMQACDVMGPGINAAGQLQKSLRRCGAFGVAMPPLPSLHYVGIITAPLLAVLY